jgi:hypothetical protein
MSIEAMKQALDALEKHGTHYARHEDDYIKAITALREAIEFQEMVKKGTKAWADTPDDWVEDLRGGAEPVAWIKESEIAGMSASAGLGVFEWKTNLGLKPEPGDVPLYTAPRGWVSLTDEEIKEIVGPWGETPIKGYTRKLFDAIEAKLREKNT